MRCDRNCNCKGNPPEKAHLRNHQKDGRRSSGEVESGRRKSILDKGDPAWEDQAHQTVLLQSGKTLRIAEEKSRER